MNPLGIGLEGEGIGKNRVQEREDGDGKKKNRDRTREQRGKTEDSLFRNHLTTVTTGIYQSSLYKTFGPKTAAWAESSPNPSPRTLYSLLISTNLWAMI